MSLKRVIGQIRKNNVFLITSHINPEADAIGSELAFLYLLKQLGKKAFIINESGIPLECRFLRGINKIQKFSGRIKRFDCAVFLDCSDSSRAGGVAKLINNDSLSLNIDHHVSNTYFADVNWVDIGASCACEMVYQLYKALRITISRDVSVMLYAGIVADTGSFRFNNTGFESHNIAASLIRKKGISVSRIYRSLYEINSLKDIKLLGPVLSGVKCDSTGKIVWVEILCGKPDNKSPSMDLSEIALNLLRSIKGVELAVVFKEVKGLKGRVRVNFRSQNNFDCNVLASRFGGGGHKNASGATISGSISNIKNKIIGYASKLVGEYV